MWTIDVDYHPRSKPALRVDSWRKLVSFTRHSAESLLPSSTAMVLICLGLGARTRV